MEYLQESLRMRHSLHGVWPCIEDFQWFFEDNYDFNSYPWLLKKNYSELISWENTSYFNKHFFEPHAEEARSATVEKRCTHQFGAMTQPRDQQGQSTFCRLSLLKSAMDPLTIESEIASHLPGIIDSLVAWKMASVANPRFSDRHKDGNLEG